MSEYVSIVDDVKRMRTDGVVHCGHIEHSASLPAVASLFSLSSDPSNYRKIAKQEAIQILTRILHKDMAYDMEIMPLEVAEGLCATFLQGFADESTVFFTNIDYSREGKRGRNVSSGPNWNPVTKATFDAGVIAISKSRSACLWIEDED